MVKDDGCTGSASQILTIKALSDIATDMCCLAPNAIHKKHAELNV